MSINPCMARAIELAERAALYERSGGCFGAVITQSDRDGNEQIIGEGCNQVLSNKDPTCHAEMQAIRDACAKLGTHILSDTTLYTSSEPCPMCLCAAAWARVPKIVYAGTVRDAKEYGAFDDEKFYAEILGGKIVRLEQDHIAHTSMIDLWSRYKQSNPTNY